MKTQKQPLALRKPAGPEKGVGYTLVDTVPSGHPPLPHPSAPRLLEVQAGGVGTGWPSPCLPPASGPAAWLPRPSSAATCPGATWWAGRGGYQCKTLQPLAHFMGFPNCSKWRNVLPPHFPQERRREEKNEVGRDERLSFFSSKNWNLNVR